MGEWTSRRVDVEESGRLGVGEGDRIRGPAGVVIVTWAAMGPAIGGTVTVHTFCAGQLVGATSPLNDATI